MLKCEIIKINNKLLIEEIDSNKKKISSLLESMKSHLDKTLLNNVEYDSPHH